MAAQIVDEKFLVRETSAEMVRYERQDIVIRFDLAVDVYKRQG